MFTDNLQKEPDLEDPTVYNFHLLAGKPLAQRLRDKEHSWSGLRELIPDLLAQGLDGYAFTCPDMIGGVKSIRLGMRPYWMRS